MTFHSYKKYSKLTRTAGNYMSRYLFAAVASAVCLPAIRKIGVGWFSTISALFIIIASIATYCCAIWGKNWRDAVDAKKAETAVEKKEEDSQV